MASSIMAANLTLLIRFDAALLVFLAGAFAVTAICGIAALADSRFAGVGALRIALAANLVATVAGAFFIPGAIDLWRGAAGCVAGVTSAMSMSNTSARSTSSSTLLAVGLCRDLRRPAAASATRSLGSTRRKAKINSGWLSRRAPTP